jgi:superfamily II DNA/RNA helicase
VTSAPSPFEQYSLPLPLMRALVAMKFTEPTPIQEQAIPIALAGGDLIGCAQTGTGKTAAFLIPTLARMIENPEEQTLILVPTRELADQVFQVIKELTQFLPHIRTVLLMGGVPIVKQFRLLRAPYRFVVATPGRLNDHLKRGSIELDFVKHLVIDEADRLLDMGFAPQLAQILNFLPDDRQSFMFSATLGENVRKLSSKYLKNPKTIRLANTTEFKKSIEQRNVFVPRAADKAKVLLEEIRKCETSVLVFTRTQINTDRVARYLQESGVNAAQIHGGRTQGQRTWALRGFKNGEYRVLVATDIASRGIDVDHVGLVVNYEMPEDPDDYVHRIGRTGRADKEGIAVNLLTRDDEELWNRISQRQGGSPYTKQGYSKGSTGDRSKERPKARPNPRPGARPSPRVESGPKTERPAAREWTQKRRPPLDEARGKKFSPRPDRIKGDRPAERNETRPARPENKSPFRGAKVAAKRPARYQGK